MIQILDAKLRQCCLPFTLATFAICLLTPSFVIAQSEFVPLSNVPPGQQNQSGLEGEIVEIRNGLANPATISRKPGRFILLLHIMDTAPQDESFSLVAIGPANADPLSQAGTQTGATLLRLERKARSGSRRKIAGLVDLPPGEFLLVSSATGKSICTIKGQQAQ